MFTKLEDLFKQSTPKKKKLVIAVGQDENSLEAAYTAHQKGVIELICTGDKEEILKIAKSVNLDFSGIEIIDEKDKGKAVELAVKLINDGKAKTSADL